MFLARQSPDSSIAKPACMKNTRNPATITQTVSAATRKSARLFAMALTSCAQPLPVKDKTPTAKTNAAAM